VLDIPDELTLEADDVQVDSETSNLITLKFSENALMVGDE